MTWDAGTEIYHERVAWSCTLSSTATAPTGWNRDTSACYYQEIGKLIVVRFAFTAAAGATWGTGNWAITLPVTAASGTGVGGEATAYLQSPAVNYFGNFYLNSTTQITIVDSTIGTSFAYFGSSIWGGSSPTTNDRCRGQFFYEAA